jgi:putative CocE/NonD family hydrolase
MKRGMHRSALLLVGVSSIACQSPSALAAPRKTMPQAQDVPPLLPSEPKDDAEIERAIREHYTKYEYRIPMRDGVHLYTVAYVPKDPSHTYPILMSRTPYSVEPYGVDNYPSTHHGHSVRRFSPLFVREGYIFVQQDVRGRMMSEGTFVDVRPRATTPNGIDESTDAYDTIDWLVKHVPSNNGNVGISGISYNGFYAAQAAIHAHPALKAVSPQAPVTEWFIGDDFHHNGALFVAAAFEFYSNFGKVRPVPTPKGKWDSLHDSDAYDFFLSMGPIANADRVYFKGEIPFWKEVFEHGARDDFWKARDPRPDYKNSTPAIMTVGGWFDAEDLFGALETYRAFERQGARSENVLVMGPWSHGGWARSEGDHLGDVTFGAKTAVFYREQIEFPFFQRHLKGKSLPAAPEVWAFETGKNEWHREAVWPPREAKPVRLYFHDKGRLSSTAPAAREGDGDFDSYVSDPSKPVPYRQKPSREIDEDYMTDDQRFAARRPDVLVYTTPPLDADVTLAGGLEASLWVSTTGTDADFVVKLIDVYPDDVVDPEPNPAGVHMAGYQQLVRAEIMRGKFRSSFERPEPFRPDEPTLVRFAIPDTFHTFRPGHRIMVQVQSSWFPLIDRNPQKFVPNIFEAKDADFQPARQQVYRSRAHPSAISMQVLPASEKQP